MSFVHVKGLVHDAYERILVPVPSVKFSGFPNLNEAIRGLRPREYSIFCGSTGCLGGNTRISINRAGKGSKMSIRDLYLGVNGLRSDPLDPSIETYVRGVVDGKVRLVKMNEVILSGIKKTARLSFSNSIQIRSTLCHRYWTPDGWKRARDLKKGDRVAVDNPYAKKQSGPKKKMYDSYKEKFTFHPYATGRLKRIPDFRAIFEANLNGLSLKDFRLQCQDKKTVKSLKFINPKTHHVHHKNHDHYDHRIENLEVMTIQDHLNHHGNLNYKNFNQGIIQWVKFKGMDRLGIEDVYDISVDSEHHSFVANNLIVHNSGKTAMMGAVACDLVLQGVPTYVASVETGPVDFVTRVMSCAARQNWNLGDPVPVECLEDFQKNFPNFPDMPLYLARYEDRVPNDELLGSIRQAVHDHGVKVAILDNLNFFMEVTNSVNQVVEMDRVIHDAIIFCKQVDVHLIVIMHPKKTMNGRVESEFDIKGSSTAVQEAHNVFLWNKPPREKLEETEDAFAKFCNFRELKIAKCRRFGKHVGEEITFHSYDGVSFQERAYEDA